MYDGGAVLQFLVNYLSPFDYPVNIADLVDNVRVVFLVPNTTSLIQLMDQGVIAMFKVYYLWCIMEQLILETDGEDKHTIRKFWKAYNKKKRPWIISAPVGMM